MTPIVAIVGRPNVGKSTLFNRLTKTRRALVDDLPGVTRDRLYGQAKYDGIPFTLVDTGGFDPPADQAFAEEVHSQIELALNEADLIVFLTDGQAGISPMDHEVADKLRRTDKPVFCAVNKVDGPAKEAHAQEFYALGMERIHFISAAHGYGISDFLIELTRLMPEPEPEDEDQDSKLIKVALLGRPNVGKSSLLNALAGAQRAVVSATAGTTRDTVDTPLTVGDKDYLLIDTAGIRRQGKVKDSLEKAVVFRSLRAVERTHIAAVVTDANEGITERDLRIAGQALEAYRGVILVVNKWDLLKGDAAAQKEVKRQTEALTRFAPWAPVLTMSAKNKKRTDRLLPLVDQVFRDFNQRISTGVLNRELERILERHQPPMVKGRRLRFYYASQALSRPPTFVMFVNDPNAVHFSYRRYIQNELRRVFELHNTPIRLILRQRPGRKPARRKKRRNRRAS